MNTEREAFLQELAAIALREIREQSLALTRQLLANQPLERREGEPVIAGIIEEADSYSAAVYFPIEDESYFFVLYLDTEPEVSLRFAGMESGNRVYCKIVSETLDLAELLRLTPLKPNWTCQKGEKVSVRSKAIRAFSGITIEPDERKYGEAEFKLDKLLDLLEQQTSCFPLQGESLSAHVQILYYGYKEQMGGVHLSAATMQRLAALGLELDLDLYAAGPDLLD